MSAKQPAPLPTIYQLKVTLSGSKPPIWRRLEVANTISLSKLHAILQTAMGWTNSHLHQFEIGGVTYSDPNFNLDDASNERRVLLSTLALLPKTRFRYEYDFGDGWLHDILVEKVLTAEPMLPYPRCLTGKRACPLEDSGGIWGYEALLETIADPTHPDYEEMHGWLPKNFDPTAFNLDDINKQLQAFK